MEEGRGGGTVIRHDRKMPEGMAVTGGMVMYVLKECKAPLLSKKGLEACS
jgi:hypothetical protein